MLTPKLSTYGDGNLIKFLRAMLKKAGIHQEDMVDHLGKVYAIETPMGYFCGKDDLHYEKGTKWVSCHYELRKKQIETKKPIFMLVLQEYKFGYIPYDTHGEDNTRRMKGCDFVKMWNVERYKLRNTLYRNLRDNMEQLVHGPIRPQTLFNYPEHNPHLHGIK